MSDLRQQLDQIKADGLAEIAAAADLAALEAVRVKYLGRKGAVQTAFEKLATLPKEERPAFGQIANQTRDALTVAMQERKASFESAGGPRGLKLDLTLPGRTPAIGRPHPITQVTDEIVRIFRRMGFSIADGPDIETEYYNFDALNTPADHPARDVQDTFYIEREKGVLLRTHTSPVQVHVMEKQQPPVRVVVPGRCYRRDEIDATHHANFHQVEGLYVDRNVSVANLMGDCEFFFKQLLGPETRVRFRPHFFPFTEPSYEIDLNSPALRMAGREWLEIAGCGMVNPRVFESVGYDSEQWTGYAFGMGVERIAMILYGIDDIRLFYENDLRFLRQF
ncbi:MAG: phenylalanine--tRNA ligase subunit alpha [Verrucomicrobia bacterium]|nr:phenylalanine--tRNA ligase subunit alpha [Verrucomicrobiota bacterium]